MQVHRPYGVVGTESRLKAVTIVTKMAMEWSDDHIH
jgi:hypothetical protein